MEAHNQAFGGSGSKTGTDEYAPSVAATSLATAVTEAHPTTNRFSKWDSYSAIRSKPRQRLREGTAVGPEKLLYFSPDLVPLSKHRLIAERNLGTQVLLQHLYNYLAFTAILEHRFVNPIMIRIAHRDIGLTLPKSMVVDAYRIYCDEGYHALCSADLTQQIEDFTGIAPIVGDRLPKPFRDSLDAIEAAPAALKPLIELAFIIVSETLVSAILTRSHLDARVEPAIRQVILEHAQDEAVHQAYFADLTRLAWPQLSGEARTFLGTAIPGMVLSFLSPDSQHMTRVLGSFGIPIDESRRIIAESHSEAEILESARRASTFTVGLFKSVGAFQDQQTHDAFLGSGLIAP